MWVHWYLALAHHDSVSHKNHLQCLLPTTVTPDHLLIQIVYQSQVEEKIHWAASIITSLFFTPSYIVILIQHCYYNNDCWQHALRRETLMLSMKINFNIVTCDCLVWSLITTGLEIFACAVSSGAGAYSAGGSPLWFNVISWWPVYHVSYWLCWLVTRILLL